MTWVTGIIAATAVPNGIDSRKAADEGSAPSAGLDLIRARETSGRVGAGRALAPDRSLLESAGLSHAVPAAETRNGEAFPACGAADGFQDLSGPRGWGSSGSRGFFADETLAAGHPAAGTGPALADTPGVGSNSRVQQQCRRNF